VPSVFGSFFFDPNLEWEMTLPDDDAIAKVILATPDGGYLVAGNARHQTKDGKDWEMKQLANGALQIIREYGWIRKFDTERNILWEQRVGGSLEHDIHDMQLTPDGGYLISVVRGLSTIWVVKLDAQRQQEWDYYFKRDDTTITDIHTLPEGDSFITGYSRPEAWAGKIDTQGNIIWENMFGTKEHDFLNTVSPTPDGGCIVGGQTRAENETISRAWVVKLNSRGEQEWERSPEVPSIDMLGTASDGGYVGIGGDHPSIFKLDAAGAVQWKTHIGNTYKGEVHTLQATPDGGCLAAGGPHAYIYSGKKDAWIVKLDAAGNEEWGHIVGGSGLDSAEYATPTPDGSWLVVGYTESRNWAKRRPWIFQLKSVHQQ
jgi:hypothetical protein